MNLSRILSRLIAPFVFFAKPALAFAQTANPRPSGQFGTPGGIADIGAGDFGRIVGNAITFVFVIAIIIALAFLVYGGVKWITSGGDKTAVEAARNTIVAAIVGLVIIFLSYFVLNIILGLFGLSLGNLILPKLI